jgi:SAM-dependent MidA family methyltransferase
VEWRSGIDQLEALPCAALVANEWLDNVPLDVLVDGRLVEVDESGQERAGPPAGARDLDWVRRFSAPEDTRVEVGWPRDDAWAAAVGRIGSGLALAIDYAIDRQRPGGTIVGFRAGRAVPPVPDGRCDLTAHVHLASCAVAVGAAGRLVSQADALRAFGVTTQLPDRALATTDPAGYLRALTASSAATELTDPAGLGAHRWLLHTPGLQPDDVLPQGGR